MLTQPLQALLDHRHLNDIIDNHTSERPAVFLYDRARAEVEALGARLAAVVVEETCTARREHRP